MLRKFFIDNFSGKETNKPDRSSANHCSYPEGVPFTFYLNPVVGGITSKQLQTGNVGFSWRSFNLLYFLPKSKQQILMPDFVNVPFKTGMVNNVHQLKSLMRLSKYFLKASLDILPFSFNPSSIISPKYKSSRFFPVITLEVFLYCLISLAAKVASRWFLNRAIKTVIDSFVVKIQVLKNFTRYVTWRIQLGFLNQSYFSKVFKEEFGSLTSEYVEKT